MAEIRINTTGGVKLYDADDSHYAQIVAGTITSNVDAITLGHDTVTIADNLSLGSDSAVLKFGADGDTTLTHTDGTGLTLNSTNKLCFNDASQYIQGASNAILDIAATDEIELTATLVDVNANLDVSGTYTGAGLMTTGGNIVIPNAGNIGSASDTDAIAIASNGVVTFSQNPVFPDGGVAVADLDIDGATDIGAAIVDADLFIVDDGAGGTNRKVTASRIKTYAGGASTLGALTDVTMDATNFTDSLLIQTNSDGSAPGTGTLSTAIDNIGIGKDVFSALTSGDDNIGIGNYAMDALTTGLRNIAIGSHAASALTSGRSNIVMGEGAYDTGTDEYGNTVIGENALGGGSMSGSQYNVVIGNEAGAGLTNGDKNVLIGPQAGDAMTASSNNVVIGHEAYSSQTTSGSNNVVIGYKAGYAVDNVNGASVYIGYQCMDDVTTGYQNVCIGYDLEGNDSAAHNQIILGVQVAGIDDGHMAFGSGNTHRVYNDFETNASWTRSSDERIKKDIQTNTDCGLDFINDLRTVTFKWRAPSEYDESVPTRDESKTEPSHKDKMYGFVAQEVKASLDKFNIKNFNGWKEAPDTKIQGISYELFVMPLVKSIQELSAKVNELEKKLEDK